MFGYVLTLRGLCHWLDFSILKIAVKDHPYANFDCIIIVDRLLIG